MTDTDPALQPEDPARRQLLGASVMMGTAFAFGIGPVAAADTKTGRDNNSMRTHTVERIQFSSGGETLVGLLCAPTGAPAARAAVVLLGPFGFVKEQSPVQYATRLADAGFVALIFDPRCSGESGGSPRRHEDPLDKIDDAKAAIAWLARRPEVDPARIGALGVCQGCSEMIAVAADEARVKALVLVSGQYLYAENLRKFFAGGGPTLEERIARGRAAKARYEAAGLVDYTDVVSATDPAAGLPWRPIHDWYIPWTSQKWGAPSRWENRYTTMSDAEVWSFDVDLHARQLRTPTLIVHGEQSDGGPEAAQHVFDRMPANDKHLRIVPEIFHTRFYDDPLVIEPTAALAVDWFTRHLA